MVTSESHMRTDDYDDPRSESSHHCLRTTQGTVANELEIERIGTPHMTASQQAEQVMIRRSPCNDIEIERIDTPHVTASQQGEQVRIVIGQRTMQKDDRSRPKIVSTESGVESERSQLQSRINKESQYQFRDRSFTTTKPRWQSTINTMEKLSTEQWISKEGDSRVYTIKSYRRVKGPPAGSLPSNAPTRQQRCPTDK